MKNKKNKENLHICTQDEIAEIYYSDEKKVFVDTGIDEFVALYKDVPDIIVDFNRKLGSVDLKIFDFETAEEIITTFGHFLHKANPDVREDIIERLVRLQNNVEEIHDYMVIDEADLKEFYTSQGVYDYLKEERGD